jgi:hypothetical protein
LPAKREAERERRAKIIHADGEYTAAEKLFMAAEVLQHQPAAIQLRYLQTLVEIGTEKNTTIVFPLPVEFISSMARVFEMAERRAEPGKSRSRRLDEHDFYLSMIIMRSGLCSGGC